MTNEKEPYLIIATDYALSCAGRCPTCVLSQEERGMQTKATTAEAIIKGLRNIRTQYGEVATLALGIGRANVLALPKDSLDDIKDIVTQAKHIFSPDELLVEVSTSLIGNPENQIKRAKEIKKLIQNEGADARFVVVGNMALVSEKYWLLIQRFFDEMQTYRGGAEIDGNGDILQIALSLDHLPDAESFVNRFKNYRFPVNLTWAPYHDLGARSSEKLAQLENWLLSFYNLSRTHGLDSSLVTRIDQGVSQLHTSMIEAVKATNSRKSIAYIDTKGDWHFGYFSALAEMDPIRFDPPSRDKTMTGSSPAELRKLLKNPACSSCEHVTNCVASGSHKLALMVLDHHSGVTTVCPNGLRKTFARSKSLKGVHNEQYAA